MTNKFQLSLYMNHYSTCSLSVHCIVKKKKKNTTYQDIKFVLLDDQIAGDTNLKVAGPPWTPGDDVAIVHVTPG